MSTLLDSREAILDALAAQGVRTATSGKLAAPVVHLEPGDPWLEPDKLAAGRRRLVRWQLTAIAGRADAEAALATLAELVDKIELALVAVAGVSLPAWGKPADYPIDGVPYAATVATIQARTA